MLPELEKWKSGDVEFVRLAKLYDEDKAAATWTKELYQGINITPALLAPVQNELDQIIEINRVGAVDANINSGKSYNSTLLVLIISMIFGILFAIFIGILLSNLISKPIKKMILVANRLSVGDIDVAIENSTKDEIGDLMNAFKAMVDNVNSQSNIAEKISNGDLSIEVKGKSDKRCS